MIKDPQPQLLTTKVLLPRSAAGLINRPRLLGQVTQVESKRLTVVKAAAQDSRNSAVLVLAAEGSDGYVSPALLGLEVGTDADGVPLQYAVPWRFGSVAQFELIVGAANEEGTRQDFVFQTPSLNSYIYNELGPDC